MKGLVSVLFALAVFSAGSSVALADNPSGEVLVTATGWIAGAPEGLVLTYISDSEIGISWTKGLDADKTMIRAKYGSYPESKDDGYQVYYGTGTSTSDTSMNLDETATGIYYRAWSQNIGEVWVSEYAEGWIQGVGMTLIAIVVLTLGLLGFSIQYKHTALMFLAAAAGIALAIYGFANMSGSGQDAYWVLGIIGAVLAIVAAMMAGLSMRSGPSGDIESVDDAYARELREGRPSRKRQRG